MPLENTTEQNNVPSTIEQGVDRSVQHAQPHQTIAKFEPQAAGEEKAEWYVADGVPGVGEKPDFFNDKTFKTLSEQAKAWGELRKKLGEKGGAAPDDGKYEINLPEEYKDISLQEDDPLLQKWKDVATKQKFSNDQFNAGIQMWVDYLKSFEESKRTEFEGAIKELGIDGESKLTELKSWFDNNFSDVMTFDEYKSSLTSPKLLKVIMEMKSKNIGMPTIGSNESEASSLDRDYFVGAMKREKGYGINMTYTKKINDLFKKYMAEQNK